MDNSFQKQEYTIAALKEEIICLDGVQKQLGDNQVGGGSGYVVGIRNFNTSFCKYHESLENAFKQLQKDSTKNNPKLLKAIKEMVINFPDFIMDSQKEDLTNKFIIADIISLTSTVVFNKRYNSIGL